MEDNPKLWTRFSLLKNDVLDYDIVGGEETLILAKDMNDLDKEAWLNSGRTLPDIFRRWVYEERPDLKPRLQRLLRSSPLIELDNYFLERVISDHYNKKFTIVDGNFTGSAEIKDLVPLPFQSFIMCFELDMNSVNHLDRVDSYDGERSVKSSSYTALYIFEKDGDQINCFRLQIKDIKKPLTFGQVQNLWQFFQFRPGDFFYTYAPCFAWWRLMFMCNSMLEQVQYNLDQPLKIKSSQKGHRPHHTYVNSVIRMKLPRTIEVNPHQYPNLSSRAEFSHRFEVMGHWRRIKGKGRNTDGERNQNGRTWIHPHIKGPDEAPIKAQLRKISLDPNFQSDSK